MAETGSIDLGRGPQAITVDHDPTAVATDAVAGTLILDANGSWWRKIDDGSTTNVVCVGSCKNNRTATAPPTVNDDSGDGYSVGSRWQDVTNDREYVCLDASVGAAVWRATTRTSDGDVHISLKRDKADYKETSSTTYTSMAKFIFRGTAVLGTPSAAKFLLWNGESGGSHYARIYDLTNTNVIAEIGPFSGLVPAIQTDSALTNLPAAESIFELQVKDTAGKRLRISDMILAF